MACDHGPGGFHMVEVVFAQDGAVLAYRVPCAGKLEGDAGVRLGGACCAYAADLVLNALRTGNAEELYRSTTLDIIGEKVRDAARRGSNTRGTRKYGRPKERLTPYTADQRLELLCKWASHEAGIKLEIRRHGEEHGGQLALYTTDDSVLVAKQVDGWWRLDETVVRTCIAGIFPHSEERVHGQDSLRKRCLACGKTLRVRSVPSHLKGRQHLEMVVARLRLAVRFLNRLGKGAR